MTINYGTADIYKLSDKELGSLIAWSQTRIATAQTLLNTRATQKKANMSNKQQQQRDYYFARKERLERVAAVLKHTLKVGDVVYLTDTEHNGLVRVTAINGDKFSCHAVYKHNITNDHIVYPRAAVWTHGFNKISKILNGTTGELETLG